MGLVDVSTSAAIGEIGLVDSFISSAVSLPSLVTDIGVVFAATLRLTRLASRGDEKERDVCHVANGLERGDGESSIASESEFSSSSSSS